MASASFNRYIGIDYSGAETPTSRLSGLQVFQATPKSEITKVLADPRGWNWTRKEIAHWLVSELSKNEPVIVGIDHAFSFPDSFLKRHGLKSWDELLAFFCQHWPTAEDHVFVDMVREGNPPSGSSDEFRLTDRWTSSARSVFQFDVQGQVAKSTHTGIPWLKFIREKLGAKVHFWPFDGFAVPPGKSVIVEVYPSILRRRYPRGQNTEHEHDAYCVARWFQETDATGVLGRYFDPPLTEEQRRTVLKEGWILGVS